MLNWVEHEKNYNLEARPRYLEHRYLEVYSNIK